jgi:hypothetical protein
VLDERESEEGKEKGINKQTSKTKQNKQTSTKKTVSKK